MAVITNHSFVIDIDTVAGDTYRAKPDVIWKERESQCKVNIFDGKHIKRKVSHHFDNCALVRKGKNESVGLVNCLACLVLVR